MEILFALVKSTFGKNTGKLTASNEGISQFSEQLFPDSLSACVDTFMKCLIRNMSGIFTVSYRVKYRRRPS